MAGAASLPADLPERTPALVWSASARTPLAGDQSLRVTADRAAEFERRAWIYGWGVSAGLASCHPTHGCLAFELSVDAARFQVNYAIDGEPFRRDGSLVHADLALGIRSRLARDAVGWRSFGSTSAAFTAGANGYAAGYGLAGLGEVGGTRRLGANQGAAVTVTLRARAPLVADRRYRVGSCEYDPFEPEAALTCPEIVARPLGGPGLWLSIGVAR